MAALPDPERGEVSAVEPTIVLDDVSKWFGDVVAVSEVTTSIGPGLTALLGPNGAGKSTILRLLAGLTVPSNGTVTVLGGNPRTDIELRRRVALVPQQEAMFDALSAFEFTELAAKLHGCGPQSRRVAEAALDQVDLTDVAGRSVATFSKGMRQRVKVAQALVGDPEVLYLDEPLTGLDPRQRRSLIDLFRGLAAEGRTVIVSSHVLDEVERLGSVVVVIAQGRLAARGDFRAIRELMDDRPHRILVRADDPRALAASLVDAGGVMAVRLESDDRIVVDTVEADRFRRSVSVLARDGGVRLLEVRPLDDDLDSVFRYLVESG